MDRERRERSLSITKRIRKQVQRALGEGSRASSIREDGFVHPNNRQSCREDLVILLGYRTSTIELVSTWVEVLEDCHILRMRHCRWRTMCKNQRKLLQEIVQHRSWLKQKEKELESPSDKLIKGMKDLQLRVVKLEKVECSKSMKTSPADAYGVIARASQALHESSRRSWWKSDFLSRWVIDSSIRNLTTPLIQLWKRRNEEVNGEYQRQKVTSNLLLGSVWVEDRRS